ncbi:MAG TPA: flagellar assembly peptidoglycan hydrolase FlgJ [Noviherbaspirillum sp.]|nr:flagellar assembly peptidoglycan hydrolase FlgJ [Noviherbaspirillum sp.]
MVNRLNSADNLAIDSKGLDSLRQAARQNSPEALKTAAKQFEALFMNMIMKSMREATPQDSIFDNDQSRMYTSMLDQQMSQQLSNRGVGLAEVLVRQLSNTLSPQSLPTDDGSSPGVPDAASLDARRFNPWQSATLPQNNLSVAGTRTDSSQPAHIQAFQDRLGAHAEEASRTTGIPAKFMLGQAALESGWGKREIRGVDGATSHNLFGIKATGGWKGKVVEAVTTEYVNGVPQKRIEKFRAYDSYADSFRDYANLLRNNPRYESVLANATDLNSFAQGLQRAGYATDPQYAAKLTRIITQNLSA